MLLRELRQKAKAFGIIRYSTLSKAELEWLVLKRQRGQSIPLCYLKPQLILSQLTRKPVWEWHRVELEALNCICLEALSYIMGIPKSGKKAAKIERLWNMVSVRTILRDFPHSDDWDEFKAIAQSFADKYLVRELRAFCKKVKRFAPSNKWGMAASLLGWRKDCNARGQRFVQSMRSNRKQQSQQVQLIAA